MPGKNVYSQILERVFRARYRPGDREVVFDRDDLLRAAKQLRVETPRNIGDLVYSFRYRAAFPRLVAEAARPGEAWVIRPAGRGKYRMVLGPFHPIAPSPALAVTKILDATPGIIARYSLGDEQALLARLRYNRLVDVFTGVACYSLQSHLRTTAPGMGQVETDEIYVGVDKRGEQYVFPVQAKGGKDSLNAVQIEQDRAVCARHFPQLTCRPLAAQFMPDGVIALFELEVSTDSLRISAERHYHLVPASDLSPEDLQAYRRRAAE